MDSPQTIENIEKYGWSCLHVVDTDGDNPPFAYSIGFEKTLGHPEVMIFGLDKEIMHNFLNDIFQQIKEGETFHLNERVKGLARDPYLPMFKEVKQEFFDEYLGTAVRYYEKHFRAWVLIWPDKNNVLPTEEGCTLTVQNEALRII